MIWHIIGQFILGAIAMLKIGSLHLILLNAIGDLLIVWGLTFVTWSVLAMSLDAKKILNFHQKTITIASWGISILFAISLNF